MKRPCLAGRGMARAASLALSLAMSIAAAGTAAAHPHVWVSVETRVIYDGGRISALEHKWTFDEMYTAMAIQGLDKNGDGTYDRAELAELAQVNMEGLKGFDYFTHAKLKDAQVKFGAPLDPWLEHKNGILALRFRLPLEAPVAPGADAFNFSVEDPTFFIAFDFAKGQPVTLADGAPAGCKAEFDAATAPDASEQTALADAFAGALGDAAQGGGTAGVGMGQSVMIKCAKS